MGISLPSNSSSHSLPSIQSIQILPRKELRQNSKTKVPYFILIYLTWDVELYDAFDFEEKEKIKKNAIISGGNTFFYRDSNEIYSLSQPPSSNNGWPRSCISCTSRTSCTSSKACKASRSCGSCEAFRIILNKKTKNYYIDRDDKCYKCEEKLWKISRNFKTSGKEISEIPEISKISKISEKGNYFAHAFEIKQNDIIELGIMQFKVIEMDTCDNCDKNEQMLGKPSNDYNDSNSDQIQYLLQMPVIQDLQDSHDSQELQYFCRICFNQIDNSEELFSPCKCTGTMKYVHKSCFKDWIILSCIELSNSSSIILRYLQCEICKDSLVPIVKFLFQDVNFDLNQDLNQNLKQDLSKKISQDHDFSHDLPQGQDLFQDKNQFLRKSPFLILQCIFPVSLNLFCMISFSMRNKNEIIIGRNSNADLVLSDSSISRPHAKVTYINNSFYINDMNSKFGTKLLINHPTQLFSDSPNCFQFGRTLMFISIKNDTMPQEKIV